MFGGSLRRQRIQCTRGIESRHLAQRIGGKGAQDRELLAQMSSRTLVRGPSRTPMRGPRRTPMRGDGGRELDRAGRQPAQARLHAKRRLHRRVKVEVHGWRR